MIDSLAHIHMLNAFMFASLLFSSANAKAASSRQLATRPTAYQHCLRKSFYTNDVRDCTAAEYLRVSGTMDVIYRRALAGLRQNQKRVLRQSQAKWQKRIKIECDNDPEINASAGGTIWPILYTECFISKTKDRTKWIRQHYPVSVR